MQAAAKEEKNPWSVFYHPSHHRLPFFRIDEDDVKRYPDRDSYIHPIDAYIMLNNMNTRPNDCKCKYYSKHLKAYYNPNGSEIGTQKICRVGVEKKTVESMNFAFS